MNFKVYNIHGKTWAFALEYDYEELNFNIQDGILSTLPENLKILKEKKTALLRLLQHRKAVFCLLSRETGKKRGGLSLLQSLQQEKKQVDEVNLHL